MKNNVYSYKPQFYYIKVGFKGVKIMKACSRDVLLMKTQRIYFYGKKKTFLFSFSREMSY